MKTFILTILILILGLPAQAQDIRFPSAVISAGGSSKGDSGTLSHWRIGQVHVITFQESQTKEIDLDNKIDWELKLYPNPVIDVLNIEITPSDTGHVVIELYNYFGKMVLIEKHVLQPVIQIGLSEMHSGIYLFKAFSPFNDKLYATKKVFKK